MHALRRIATPASVAVVLGGCALPVDDFKAPAKADAALTTNGDAAKYDEEDACVCVKEVNGKCKEWSSPSCAR